jgi:hypothetical protein
MRYRPDRTSRTGRLSIDLLGNVLSDNPTPGSVILVIGQGTGSTDPSVEFRYAGRRGRRVSNYSIMTTPTFTSGVNVAAGNLDSSAGMEIVVTEANSDDGTVGGVVYKQDEDPSTGVISWLAATTFVAFDANEAVPVNTDPGGVNVAVGRVVSGGYQEMVVGPLQGPGVVRMFNNDGDQIEQWTAYSEEYGGVNVAVGELDSDGAWEIVTGPVSGPPRVRAWEGDSGFFYIDDAKTTKLDFLAFSTCVGGSNDGLCCTADTDCAGDGSCTVAADHAAGVEVAVADVDADGTNEILAASSGQGDETRIMAYEVDGSCVDSWTSLRPFGPGRGYGVELAATSRFFQRGAGARAASSSSKRKGRKKK